jgi:hypothetical protein
VTPRLRSGRERQECCLIQTLRETTVPETTAAVPKAQLGSRVASSSDRWILRRLKAPSRPGICPSRTESSRFRLTSAAALNTPRQSKHDPSFVSRMCLLLIGKSALHFYAPLPRSAAAPPDALEFYCALAENSCCFRAPQPIRLSRNRGRRASRKARSKLQCYRLCPLAVGFGSVSLARVASVRGA